MKETDIEAENASQFARASENIADDLRRAEAAKAGSPYLDTTQAAHYLRISPRTLQKKCRENIGPVVHWIGDRPRFLVRELDAWSLRKR